MTSDFNFRNEGTIILLIPVSDQAKDWTAQNLQAEAWQKLGDGIAIYPRMFQDILDGINAAGFKITAC